MRALIRIAALAIAVAPLPAGAADFRSIAESGAVLYDAPSARARKLYVATRYLPVEVVVSIEGWAKVRDSAGDLAWIERKALSDLRTVIVTATVADVRTAPEEQAAALFRAGAGVALELVEVTEAGWVRVRHRDGQTGFMRAAQVWGL